MLRESKVVTAPELWEQLFNKYPISLFTGVTYIPHQHGVPSQNFPITQWKDWIHPYDKSGRSWPYLKSDLRVQHNELVAVGSPVLLRPSKEKNTDVQYMAFLTMDFDCPKSPENLSRILSTLSNTFKNNGFFILDSGNSYHCIVDALLYPKNLPWHYGQIIKNFAQTEQESTKMIFDSIGSYLQSHYQDPEIIKEVCNSILRRVKHYDDSGKGLCFIFDLRWMAHSLLEFCDYLDGKQSGFCHLRASAQTSGGQPPVVIARVDK